MTTYMTYECLLCVGMGHIITKKVVQNGKKVRRLFYGNYDKNEKKGNRFFALKNITIFLVIIPLMFLYFRN